MSRKTGSLKLSSNIEPRASAPLDARMVVPTLADLTASGAFPYPYIGMIVAVQATGQAFILTASDTTVSANWTEVGSGGSSTLAELTDTNISEPSNGQQLTYDSATNKWKNTNAPVIPSTDNCFKTDDTPETTIANDDYFPFYDTSATAKKLSLWSNIKSVLKTYFDGIYSTFSGSYNDLSNKPTIPSKTSDLTNDSGYITSVSASDVGLGSVVNTGDSATPVSGGTTKFTTGGAYTELAKKADKPTVLNATLTAGSTSVTFSSVPTSGNYLITVYTSAIGLDYDSISQSGSTVTVTYPAQSSNITVYLKIEGV